MFATTTSEPGSALVDATFRTVRATGELRNAVLGGISHEQWRTMLRETYPAGALSGAWIRRFGPGMVEDAGPNRADAIAKLARHGWEEGL